MKDTAEPGVASIEDVIGYWVDETGPEGWYRGGEDLDAEIREKFATTLAMIAAGKMESWRCSMRGTLAYLIVTDQFSRNIHRGSGDSFATDHLARAAAKQAIDKGWDMSTPEPERQFFYMPLMHSECGNDQDRCVRLMLVRMPETGAANLLHAKAHREVIRRFGRFPFRNAALGRTSSEPEQAFLETGAYGAIVREMESLSAA